MESKTRSGKTNKVKLSQTANKDFELAELWLSFYAIANHWQSDLKFFEDELNFFRLLIDKNLFLLIEPKNIEQTRKMVSQVMELEKERRSLHDQISKHAQHIANLAENPFAQNAQPYKDEHSNLESAFGNFINSFRAIKSDIFRLTQQVARSERAKHIIDWG